MALTSPETGVLDKTRSPPVKVLSGQLRDGKIRIGSNGKSEFSIKRVGQGKENSLVVSIVWMQGTVVEVQPDRNTIVLLDETGNFVVGGVNNIPKGKPCLIHGKYVMVMGQVQTHSPEPVLRAVKMADLSDNSLIHKRLWKYEVEDLQQTLP
ncbi:hypothetical protein AALO_G00085420 [Alosa alosa]|uniref:RecQ-mediated genome instability protein 2 n=1 Tax=Alosa alosa TaxID=278164 RepID=A0AAV6GZ17_9TELE|nr:recQ-mediated genome instability protein 2 [Alosa sapidissima]XP_048102963.1 recQ-mediated genome instability protein 2 [Alosa alosa]KAG5280140.1 hypothetical protein AALO_G00085420 [Alosa alosa]